MLTVVAAGAGATLALGGCSLLDSSHPAADSSPNGTAAATHPAASQSSYSPLSGPVEAANQLPRDCPDVLSTAQVQAVFGPGTPIGTDYGAYAALPNIGRTGRVACVFGVGLDSFGRQSTGTLEVAIATYTSASDAVGRAANTVQQDTAAGATTARVSVGGHPATIVVEPRAVGASSTPPEAQPTATAATQATGEPGGAAASASATASSAGGPGETELVLADGNRTFVLQIPFARLAPTQAADALTRLALDVYRNTLPKPGSSATQSSSIG